MRAEIAPKTLLSTLTALNVLAGMDAAHVLGQEGAVRHQPAFWKAGGAGGVDNLAVIFTAYFPVCTENLNPNVLTMKSAHYGARIYDAGSLNLARDRRIL